MRTRRWIIALGGTGIVASAYLLGPAPATPKLATALPPLPQTLPALDSSVRVREAAVPYLKPNNQARIVWHKPAAPAVTPVAMVYLHGFSASQMEGHPVHRQLAQRYGANLYLARLAEHGVDGPEQMATLTPESYYASALHALAVGRRLGQRVVLVCTSAGAALGLKLAADHPEAVAALVLYSPCIRVKDGGAEILDRPWGLQIGRQVVGGTHRTVPDISDTNRRYWQYHYRLEGLVTLQTYLRNVMTEATFVQVRQPVLMVYWYEDEARQDDVVSVAAMRWMYAALGTPDSLKRDVPLATPADHVIASQYKSRDVDTVRRVTERFLEDVLHLQPQARVP